jgi:uncharacterized integral membrane protein (TIGR00698 family)
VSTGPGTARGIALVVLVAIAARLAHRALPDAASKVVGEVIFAVLLGLVLGNIVSFSREVSAGIRFSYRLLLPAAIVLLGAGLTVQQVVAIGGKALGMIVALMALSLLVAHLLGKLAGVSGKLATLIGVGTSVCGNSAIGACAPVIGAAEEEVSFAIATNTLAGTVAVFLYPLLGRMLDMSDGAFGTWVGTAVNDTSQVVATGFAVSEAAGNVATTVKLTRNALMGVVIVGLSLAYTRGLPVPFGQRVKRSIPPFVVGFLLVALLNTLGVIGRDLAAAMRELSRFLILVSLAGVGLATRFRALRSTGLEPLYVGFATALVASVASYLLIRILGPAG